ncbi:MAG: YidC/Oxa1 family membrane protein insertase [Oscillospiraceae bacterium]|nr:YidC/Oxa1 family membrane protein insertase [Oscillospiraceae bacterium]
MFRMIAVPLGLIMELCYNIIKDYGLALLAFTIVIKLITLPLQIKQQKSTAKMQKLQPELDKIKKKYGKDQQKYQEKMTEFYAKSGVSPMASCLPMLITMLILFSLIHVVYDPLTYVLNDVENESFEKAGTVVKNMYTISYEIKDNDIDFNYLVELYDKNADKQLSDEEKDTFIKALASGDTIKGKNDEEFKFKKTGKLDKDEIEDVIDAFLAYNDTTAENAPSITLYEYMIDTDKVSSQLQSRPELIIINMINDGYTSFYDDIDEDIVKEVDDFNYTLLGFNLGVYPKWNNITVLIPLLSFAFQLISSFYSTWHSKKTNPNFQMAGAMKGMMYFMPILSLFIAFGFPAGLGIYWIYSSVISLLQMIILNKVYSPERVDKLVEKEMANQKNKRKTMLQKMIEYNEANGTNNATVERMKKSMQEDEDDDDEEEPVDKTKLSKAELKELQRKKLNEARRRMAEKYGDEYTED